MLVIVALTIAAHPVAAPRNETVDNSKLLQFNTEPEKQSELPSDATSAATQVTCFEEPKPLHIEEIPLSYELQDTMQEACEKYGVPYELALGVAECESNFDLDADNGTCWGLMQIHPCNYPRLRENGIEPTEHKGNIVAGVFMLGELLEKYGDTHKALMAYNCGDYRASCLWEQGYLSSRYSRKVTECSEKWQQKINN